MLMLVIGALLIGYLIYFAATSFRTEARQRAVGRRDADTDRDTDQKAVAASRAADPDGDQVASLEARIAVLERIIADGPASPAAGQVKPDPSAESDRRE